MDKKLSKLRRLRVKIVAYLIKREAWANVKDWRYRILYCTVLLVHFHLVANVFDSTFSLEDMAGFVAAIVFLNETLLKK